MLAEEGKIMIDNYTVGINKQDASDFQKKIVDDYECTKDCRECPFPGAKCYGSKYKKMNTAIVFRSK